MYAVYHGLNGLTQIAKQVVAKKRLVQQVLIDAGHKTGSRAKLDNALAVFDTFVAETGNNARPLIAKLERNEILVRKVDINHIGLSFDETTTS